MAGEFADFFTELLYGSGSILALILILILTLAITVKWRYSGVLMFPILIILGINYLNVNLEWNAVLSFFGAIFTVVFMVKEIKPK